MKKAILILFIICGSFAASLAQSGQPIKLSIGADLGIPTGPASEIYSFVPGGSVKLEVPTKTANLKLLLGVGYNIFVVKTDYNSVFANASYALIETGAKYYFTPVIYAEGDFGASINTNANYSSQRVGLLYAPGVGVSIPISASGAIDVSARYEGRVESAGTIAQFALRVAYKFSL